MRLAESRSQTDVVMKRKVSTLETYTPEIKPSYHKYCIFFIDVFWITTIFVAVQHFAVNSMPVLIMLI